MRGEHQVTESSTETEDGFVVGGRRLWPRSKHVEEFLHARVFVQRVVHGRAQRVRALGIDARVRFVVVTDESREEGRAGQLLLHELRPPDGHASASVIPRMRGEDTTQTNLSGYQRPVISRV